jgi:hypothetical protein
VLRFKESVRVLFFGHQLTQVLAAACIWSMRTRVDVEVNSIDDPAPGRTSTTLHGDSLAVDLDTAGDKHADLVQLAEYLRRCMDPAFDVVLESDHVHVEYDAKRPRFERRRPI